MRVPARRAPDLLADARRAGEGHLVHARVGRQGGAGRAGSGDHVDDPRGQIRLGDQLGQQQRRQGRRLCGLQHHRVPAGESRRDLPGGHQQREVPRDDLPHHPERARRHARHGVLELVGPPGVVEEVGRGQKSDDVG